MPWKERSVMDERMRFVARRLVGEAMAELCREFGISRKTGYKIFDRHHECGIQGLTDRSRRPHHYAHKLPFQVENYILNVKHEHATWGARKIRERLVRRFSGIKIPAKSASMRCSIAMALSSVVVVHDGARKALRSRWVNAPTNCGAPITRASSCSGIANIAIR
jgi:hypothetical protein